MKIKEKTNNFIPVSTPLFEGNEKKYLNECIDTGWVSSDGPFVKKFEELFAKQVNRKYGIAVTNGTTALEVAVLSLDIKKGDEVIMPTFTIISCANAIIRAGAKPVLVDSDPKTWNMDANQIEAKITNKTKAIMVVHIYGLPVDMDPIIKIANKHELQIIEDAAEAHGLSYKDKPCGSFGKVSTFSFYANKLITMGEGGIIVTDDEKIAEKCRSLRNLCFGKKRFIHEEMGFNNRITNIQAALGVAQLEQIKKFKKKKTKIGKEYTELLKDVNNIQLPMPKTSYAENVYWVYGIILGKKLKIDAEYAMKKLAEMKIGSRPFFWPIHEQPVFKKMGLFSGDRFPVAENISRKGFYIPSGLTLQKQDIKRVAKSLKEILSQ